MTARTPETWPPPDGRGTWLRLLAEPPSLDRLLVRLPDLAPQVLAHLERRFGTVVTDPDGADAPFDCAVCSARWPGDGHGAARDAVAGLRPGGWVAIELSLSGRGPRRLLALARFRRAARALGVRITQEYVVEPEFSRPLRLAPLTRHALIAYERLRPGTAIRRRIGGLMARLGLSAVLYPRFLLIGRRA